MPSAVAQPPASTTSMFFRLEGVLSHAKEPPETLLTHTLKGHGNKVPLPVYLQALTNLNQPFTEKTTGLSWIPREAPLRREGTRKEARRPARAGRARMA